MGTGLDGLEHLNSTSVRCQMGSIEMSQTSPFITWLEVKVNGEVLTTVQPAQHQRKQSARHLACLLWIEAYIQDVLVSPQQRVQLVVGLGVNRTQAEVELSDLDGEWDEMPVHPILSKTLKDGQNFISLLSELCQGLRWASPEYEFSDAEDGFICECQLEVMNQLFVGKGMASMKQLAKHSAARAVLEQLQFKNAAEI
jgi:ribonuclease R